MKLLFAMFVCAALWAQEPQFTKDNRLTRPADYREWIFLSSGLGMTYGAPTQAGETHPQFTNVFVNPSSYRAFLKTGTWPDKTMFILEVRDSSTKGSINEGGHFQNETARLSAEVKDSSRFKDKWEYFAFPESGEAAQALPRSAGCFQCHSQNAAVENSFVQFYPTLLPIARAKGTLKK